MRRKDREISAEQALAILDTSSYGILSLVSPEGQPYGVPVNHVYIAEDRALYIHCAQEGQKLDFLRANPRASFTAVKSEQIVEEKFTTRYESAIVFGTASLIEEKAQKVRVLNRLCDRLTPSMAAKQQAYIDGAIERVAVIRLTIEAVTGKCNRAGI